MVTLDYGSPWFIGLLQSAQDGDVEATHLVVIASGPCVWKLTGDVDEQQELFAWIMEYALPKWTEAKDWALHLRVVLGSRLAFLRRTRQRRRDRGLGWL